MANNFNLQIVTPSAMFFDDEADMLIVRTSEGDIGIMANHEPLVAPIRVSRLRIKIGDSYRSAAVSNGFMTVMPDKVTIVTDACEWAENIDMNRAEKAKQRAEDLLRKQDHEVDVVRAKSALLRASNRIDVHDFHHDK